MKGFCAVLFRNAPSQFPVLKVVLELRVRGRFLLSSLSILMVPNVLVCEMQCKKREEGKNRIYVMLSASQQTWRAECCLG